MNGSVRVCEIHSPALSGNPLGDPDRRQTPIYLPPGYERTSNRYPVIYFLHGFCGQGQSWLNVSPFSLTPLERLDGLIASDAIPPVIGVFADGWTALGGGQWINSEATGRYEDYLSQDVVGFVDRTLRTVPSSAGRAAVGKSSGGYGALAIGCHRPEVFGHIGAHSADAYFEYCYLPTFPKAAVALKDSAGIAQWFDAFIARARETSMKSDDFHVVEILAMSAAYSPKMGEPMNFDLPFETATGRIRTDVWERWLENDPVRFVPARISSLRRLKSIFIDCGSRDEYYLQLGARMVAEVLTRAGIELRHEEFDDGHTGTNYRYAESLKYLAPRLAR